MVFEGLLCAKSVKKLCDMFCSKKHQASCSEWLRSHCPNPHSHEMSWTDYFQTHSVFHYLIVWPWFLPVCIQAKQKHRRFHTHFFVYCLLTFLQLSTQSSLILWLSSFSATMSTPSSIYGSSAFWKSNSSWPFPTCSFVFRSYFHWFAQGTVLSHFTLFTNDCSGSKNTPLVKYSDDFTNAIHYSALEDRSV